MERVSGLSRLSGAAIRLDRVLSSMFADAWLLAASELLA